MSREKQDASREEEEKKNAIKVDPRSFRRDPSPLLNFFVFLFECKLEIFQWI